MANKWIKWQGGKCPVNRGTLVDVKYRDGVVKGNIPALKKIDGRGADSRWWIHDGWDTDIVAYRLSEAPERPRTKSGKPKVETPKRKRVRKPVELPADPYEAYKADYVVTYKEGPADYRPFKMLGTLTDGKEPDKSLADSVILVALGIVSGAIATAACFLIFA